MVKRRFLSVVIVILSLVLISYIGCRDQVLQEDAMAETYLNKIWITGDWTEGDCSDVVFCFLEMADGKCEGELVRKDNLPFKREGNVFSGVLHGNAAECRFMDFQNRTGTVTFTFLNENEIEAVMVYDDGEIIQNRQFRPYNIKDLEEFILQEEQTVRTELEYWGNVYFVAGIDEGDDEPLPKAYLVNKNFDILFGFRPSSHAGSKIYDVVFEDINEDGLTDVTVCTYYADESGAIERTMPYIDWLFRQSADRTFYLVETRYSNLRPKGFHVSVKDNGVMRNDAKAGMRYYPHNDPVDGNTGLLAYAETDRNGNSENDVPEELLRILSTALQNNTLDDCAAEMSAEYAALRENEIWRHIWEDTSGTLESFYYDDLEGGGEWFLFERDNDIIVRQKTDHEEYPYCYYKFSCKGRVYDAAFRAYGKNGDFFFISWGDDDYLLVTRRAGGQVKGIAVYQMGGHDLIGWISVLEKTSAGEIEAAFYHYVSRGKHVREASFPVH